MDTNIIEDSDTEELDPSELGTKTYWDASYVREIKNYLSHGDPGEVCRICCEKI